MATISIITNLRNTWGLSKDVQIVQNLLTKHGHTVQLHQWDASPVGPKAHMNIHLEIMGGKWFNHARRNVLIPNQEWFLPDWANRSKLRFDATFCKTRHATVIFEGMGLKNVVYTGFTSVDCLLPNVSKSTTAYHLAGNSLFKNTFWVLANWQPTYPDLYVYGSNPELKAAFEIYDKVPNIHCRHGHVPDAEILQTINQHTWAIQPSASEGFGHCLVEPLSAGTQVVTLAAPPMGEFPVVHTIPGKHTGKHCLGDFYEPTGVIDLTRPHYDTRTWWLENNANFETRFMTYIEGILR